MKFMEDKESVLTEKNTFYIIATLNENDNH